MVDRAPGPRSLDLGRGRLTPLVEFLRRAVERGDFVLSSGERSDVIVDVPRAILTPGGYAELGYRLGRACYEHEAQGVGGVLTGGALAATSVCLAGRSAFAIRPRIKVHGLGGQIVGPRLERALILDDVVTTGESLLSAALAARDAGIEVRGTLAVVSRSEAARARLEEALGVPCRALVTLDELLA